MKVDVGKLKQFIDIVGFSIGGIDIKVTESSMTASVINDVRNVVVMVELPVIEGKESNLRIEKEIFLKYLRNIGDKVVDITSDDTLITISDENVEIYFPQIHPSIVSKSRKELPKDLNWKLESSFSISSDHIKKILSITDNVNEKVVVIESKDGNIKAKIKNKAIVKNMGKIISGDDFTVKYHLKSLVDAMSGAFKTNVIISTYKDEGEGLGKPPSTFSYIIDDMCVSGIIAEWVDD